MNQVCKLICLGALACFGIGDSVFSAERTRNKAKQEESSFITKTKNLFSDIEQHVEASKDLLAMVGPLLHVPYILTLDSDDSKKVRLAGLLAMLPTGAKVIYKSFEKCNGRFLTIVLPGVPKYLGYSVANLYDWINVTSPRHMILERQQKGDYLKRIKVEQGAYLAFEVLLRIISFFASYKADNAEYPAGRSDLKTVGALASEFADWIELWRLLGRYKTYSTTPGLDISCNVDIKHADGGFSALLETGIDYFDGHDEQLLPLAADASNGLRNDGQEANAVLT